MVAARARAKQMKLPWRHSGLHFYYAVGDKRAAQPLSATLHEANYTPTSNAKQTFVPMTNRLHSGRTDNKTRANLAWLSSRQCELCDVEFKAHFIVTGCRRCNAGWPHRLELRTFLLLPSPHKGHAAVNLVASNSLATIDTTRTLFEQACGPPAIQGQMAPHRRKPGRLSSTRGGRFGYRHYTSHCLSFRGPSPAS